MQNDSTQERLEVCGNDEGRSPDAGDARDSAASLRSATSNRSKQAQPEGEEVKFLVDPFAMNRSQRRRMKKDLKLGRTPSRVEAGTMIIAGYNDAKLEKKPEPVKVRIPRAFSKPIVDRDRVLELPDA